MGLAANTAGLDENGEFQADANGDGTVDIADEIVVRTELATWLSTPPTVYTIFNCYQLC